MVEFAAIKQVQKLKLDFCITSAPNPNDLSYDVFLVLAEGFVTEGSKCE